MRNVVAFSLFVPMLMLAFVPTATAAPADYTIDPAHASTVFRVSHLGFSYTYGMIPDIAGTFTFDPEDASAGKVDVTYQTASVNTMNESRDKHLRSPDFFNVKEFPEMTFKSTKWEKVKDDIYEITGDFTLLGTTKEITFRMKLIGMGEGMQGKERAGFEGVFSIVRSDYGMDYGLPGVGDEVTVTVSLEGIKE